MRRSTAALVWAALAALRFIFASRPSYIHPDEFFQGPEIAAGDILGLRVHRTWEFTSAEPIRSVLPIYVFCGPPMLLIRVMQGCLGYSVTSASLFRASRVFAAGLSLLVDYNVYKAIRRNHPGARVQATMVLLATSYCLFVFHAHTFANAYASVVLSVCFNVLSAMEQRSARRVAVPALMSLALGVLLGFGSFVHISFAMFALPVGVGAMLLGGIGGTGWLVLGGILAAAVCVAADTAYYGGSSALPVLTVLNNLGYNSNSDNLATHGRHPRYMHLLVSMPALFGPLLFLAIAGLWVAVKRRGRSQLSYLDACATASVLSGLGLLSLAPHQEPRFMVPALSGMVIASWRWHRAAPRYFWWLWAVFNLVLALAYGVVHQAGVVPAARYLAETSVFGSPVCRRIAGSPADAVCAPQSSGAAGEASDGRWAAANVTTRALFYASYPAPRHLLTQHSHRADQQLSRVKLTDLIMMEDEEVRSVLSAQPLVRCALAAGTDNGLVFTQTEQGGFERSLLAVPASADLARIRPPGSSLALLPIFRYQPHVNFDHIGEVVQKPMDRSTFNVFLMCQK